MDNGGTPAHETGLKAVLRNPWLRFIGLLILIFIGLRVLYVIRGVLIPFCLAVIAAYIFDPVVDWLERRRIGPIAIGRRVSVGLLVTVFAAVIGLALFVAIPNAILAAREWLQSEKFDTVRQILPPEWQKGIETWVKSSPDERWLIVSRLITTLLTREGAPDAVTQSLHTILFSTFSAALWVFQFFLFFVVTVYLLVDIDRARDRVKDALPLRHKDEILRIAGHIDANLKSFFRGQMIVVLVDTVVFTAGLALVGTPFWYVIGIIGGLGAFVPYFALVSGMVPAIVLTFAQHQDVLHPAAAAAVFAVGLTVDSLFTTPHIMGKRVGVHPVIVILAIFVFGTLFGFLGVLFAVPIAAVVKVIAQELFVRYKASELYNGLDRSANR